MSKLPQFDFFVKWRKKKIWNVSSQPLSIPKKPLTAYAIFVKKVGLNLLKAWKEYLEQRGDNSNSNDMMKELGKLWSHINPLEKKFYERLSWEGKLN